MDEDVRAPDPLCPIFSVPLILLAIFIGNDFLPHLPDFHINENALEMLFEIYKLVLPKCGGYIVHQGTINMERLQMVLDELAKGEEETFLRETADLNYIHGKQRKYAKDAHKSTPPSESGERPDFASASELF